MKALHKYRALFENSRDAIFITAPEGTIIDVNQAMLDLYGYTKEEILNINVTEFYVDPFARGKYRKKIERNGFVKDHEIRFRKKNDTQIDVLVTATVLRDDKGDTTAYQGILRDITQDKQQREEIRNLNEELELRVEERTKELELAVRQLEEYDNMVSHDLRKPLHHITGFVDKFSDHIGPDIDSEGIRLLQKIETSAERMNEFILNLLDFSKIRKIELHFSDISIKSVVQDLISEFEEGIRNRKIKWKIHSILPTVHGDRATLKLVWDNLISNALKFTSGRKVAEIEIGSNPHNSKYTELFIKDNGIGFEQKYTDTLFKPFKKGHQKSEFEGTGIGLSIVENIVRRHDGKVWAKGIIGKGAIFYILLPNSEEK